VTKRQTAMQCLTFWTTR